MNSFCEIRTWCLKIRCKKDLVCSFKLSSIFFWSICLAKVYYKAFTGEWEEWTGKCLWSKVGGRKSEGVRKEQFYMNSTEVTKISNRVNFHPGNVFYELIFWKQKDKAFDWYPNVLSIWFLTKLQRLQVWRFLKSIVKLRTIIKYSTNCLKVTLI